MLATKAAKIKQKRYLWALGIILIGCAGILILSRLSSHRPRQFPLSNLISLSYSADGKTFATTSSNQRTGEVKIWNSADWRLKRTIRRKAEERGYVEFTAFAPNGKLILGAGDNTATLWDLNSGDVKYELSENLVNWSSYISQNHGRLQILKFSHMREHISSIELYDLMLRKSVWKLKVEFDNDSPIAISPDFQKIAILDRYSSRISINLIDFNTGRMRTLPGTSLEDVGVMCFSHNGRELALADINQVEIWNLRPFTVEYIIHCNKRGMADIGAIAFSPDDTILALGGNVSESTLLEAVSEDAHHFGSVWLWHKGNHEITQMSGYDGGVHSLLFSPDGKNLWCNNQFVWNLN